MNLHTDQFTDYRLITNKLTNRSGSFHSDDRDTNELTNKSVHRLQIDNRGTYELTHISV
jgi:hypothetical protein